MDAFDSLLEPLTTRYFQEWDSKVIPTYRRISSDGQRLTSLGVPHHYNLRAARDFKVGANRTYTHDTRIILELPSENLAFVYRPQRFSSELELHPFILNSGDRSSIKLSLYNGRRNDTSVRRGDVLACFCVQQLAFTPVHEVADPLVFDPVDLESMIRADERNRLVMAHQQEVENRRALLVDLESMVPDWPALPAIDETILPWLGEFNPELLTSTPEPPMYEDISDTELECDSKTVLDVLHDEIELTPADKSNLTPLSDDSGNPTVDADDAQAEMFEKLPGSELAWKIWNRTPFSMFAGLE